LVGQDGDRVDAVDQVFPILMDIAGTGKASGDADDSDVVVTQGVKHL
jgi:hypothetical protein